LSFSHSVPNWNGPEQIKLLLEGIAFRDGEPVQGDQPVQQKLAA
jgi:putative transposase